jgi:glutamate/tyrosine decarboxylase-like PLP-dependent enzyme
MLLLEKREREALWRRLVEIVEGYADEVATLRVAPELDPRALRAALASFDFERPKDPIAALEFAADGLRRHQVHTPHPRYFGLFNPSPTTMGIAADALVAAFNPQLAAWSHGPLAVEIEQHLVRALAGRFGFDPAGVEGTFASGGTEANHTALLAALVDAFPDVAAKGVRALPAQPVLYVSAEGHHSLHKAARAAGLGTDAVREVQVDARLRMNVASLAAAIARDRAAGLAPFLVVATAGGTSSGGVDPLGAIADVAARERLWLHVDAAWGGAAALVAELRPVLEGIERADSVTFDAHKWLSVPMGAGIFFTRRQGSLERAFRIDSGYMPRDAAGLDVVDPHATSLQWSRRFIGLKVFLSLAVAGWEGYAAAIRHQTAMGDRLRAALRAAGFEIVNDTPLPLVCFVDARDPRGRAADRVDALAQEVVRSGAAWISSTRVGGGRAVLRACITNHLTEPADVDALVEALEEARRRVSTSS